jgi:hypothetical protein
MTNLEPPAGTLSKPGSNAELPSAYLCVGKLIAVSRLVGSVYGAERHRQEAGEIKLFDADSLQIC